jgi:hypothetical protein
MFGLLPNPWLIIGVLLAISSAFGGGYWKGHHDAETAMQIEVARLNDEARTKERRLNDMAVEHATELRKAQDDAKAEKDRIAADMQSGSLWLSVACSQVSATAGTAPASRLGIKAQCRLDQTASRKLLEIAAQGDDAIRQLNALIDFYNDVRGNLNER